MKPLVVLAGMCWSILMVPAMGWGGPTYFVMSEVPGREVYHDSFVVPIDDPQHLAHARDLIARGPDVAGDAIVVARIAPGSGGINRDLLHPDQPEWSWHVTEVEEFAFMNAELYDTTPSYLQANRDDYIADTAGRIGMWQYTITRELSGPPGVVVPLPAGVLSGAGLLLGAWSLRKSIAR